MIAATTDGADRVPPIDITAGGVTWPRPLSEALEECDEYPHVKIVRDEATLHEIGRLRHRQYVEAQGKRYTSVAFEANCLIEAPDFSGVNICSLDQQGLSAAMRIGLVTDPAHPCAALFGEVAENAGIDTSVSLTCTRLVKADEHKGRHAADLVRFVRLQTVTAGYRYCIMQTAERLVPYFQRFEFFSSGRWIDDPAAGLLQIMILDTKLRPVQNQKANDVRE